MSRIVHANGSIVRCLICAALVFAATCHPACAIFIEGNELHQSCTMPIGSAGRGACENYILGVADVLDAMRSVNPSTSRVCIPEGATTGQVIDVAIHYLDQNAQERYLAAVVIVGRAFQKAFPCP